MRSVRSGVLLAAILAVSMAAAAQTAALTSWPLPGTRSVPGELAVAGDVVYVSLRAPGSVARLDPAVDSFDVWPVGEAPLGIAITDRGLFYTLPDASAVGTLQPGISVVARWTTPTASSSPEGLIATPLGPGAVNLWFNERAAGRVGRYAPATVVLPLYLGPDPASQPVTPSSVEITAMRRLAGALSFPADPQLVPPVGLAPKTEADGFTEWTPIWAAGAVEAIAVAADGHVWFSQEGETPLTALDPATGAMSPYGLPPGTRVGAIAAAATGRVWFTDASRPALGRLDPATADVTLWEIPEAGQPFDLAVDAQGDLWFTDREANALYNFRPSTGEFVWWPIGAGRRPAYLELGDAGAVWFVEEGGAVSRLVVGSSSVPTTQAPIDSSGFHFGGYSFHQRGNLAEAEVSFLYEGGMGAPIYIGAAALAGGVRLTDCVCTPVAVSETGFFTVDLQLRYVGSTVAASDTLHFYVALQPGGAPIVVKEIPAAITWVP